MEKTDYYQIKNDAVTAPSEGKVDICPVCHQSIKKSDDVRVLRYGSIHEDCLLNTPFAITMEKRRFAGEDMKIYGIYFTAENEGSVELTGNEARDLVLEFGLTEYVKCREGKLWSSEEFKSKYKGHFESKRQHQLAMQARASAMMRERKRIQTLNINAI